MSDEFAFQEFVHVLCRNGHTTPCIVDGTSVEHLSKLAAFAFPGRAVQLATDGSAGSQQ